MSRAAVGLLPLLVLAATTGPAAQEGWRPFEGSWSAAGERQSLAVEDGGEAATLRISGSLVLTTGEGLSRGFRGEMIGFDDGRAVRVGRAVWTDERGDRIFSVLEGEEVETGRRVAGTITGGTGRYAGLRGEFTLTWRYVVRGEDDTIQGRTTDLRGRFLLGSARR